MLKMLVFQIKISEFGSLLYVFHAVTELDVLAKEINSAFVGLWRIRQFKRTNSSPIPSAKSLHKLSMSRLPFVSCKYSESNRKHVAVIEKEMKRSSLKPFDIFRAINICINLYEIEETWVRQKIMGLKK